MITERINLIFLFCFFFSVLKVHSSSTESSSDFCTSKRYDKPLIFISQQSSPGSGKYLLFGDDDLYYSIEASSFNGSSFTQIPTGPLKLTSLPGVQSVAAYLAESADKTPDETPFAALLFIRPQLVLQFLGRQVWLVNTETGDSSSLSWPPPSSSCPPHIGAAIILSRTGEEDEDENEPKFLLFDQKSYAYNLSVSFEGTESENSPPKIACSPRSEVALFPEDLDYLGAAAMMALVGKPPPVLQCSGLLVLRWMRSRTICRSCLPPGLNVATPYCDQAAQLPNKWALFGCPDPAEGEKSPRWLVGVYIAAGVAVLLALALTAYYLGKRVFNQTKQEIVSISSKIG